MYSAGEGVNELEGQPVHVGHGKDGYKFFTRRVTHLVKGVAKVGPHTAVREHHAFGRAGGTGRVVDHGQFFRFLRAVVYILDSQFPGVPGGKQGFQPGGGFQKNRVAGGDHGIISHGDDPVERGHTLVVYVIHTDFPTKRSRAPEWLIMWWIVSGLNSLGWVRPQPRKVSVAKKAIPPVGRVATA